MPNLKKFIQAINSSPKIKKAYDIACKAHKEQVDKAGVEYIQHPLTVASLVGSDEKCIITALLHDVAEDTTITLEELGQLFGNEIKEALTLLTHKKDVSYFEYIKKIKTNPIARQVKIADLKHNSDLNRILNVRKEDIERVEKYKKAQQILMSD